MKAETKVQTNGRAEVENQFDREESRSPLWRFFLGQPVPLFPDGDSYSEADRGYVTTGEATIQSILSAFREGQHVMLVGPRGTGKSYMAGQAVDEVKKDARFGTVAVITLQGDPNKPPSDYFDDSIAVKVEQGRTGNGRHPDGSEGQQSQQHGSQGKLVPTTIRAPMFKNARPLPDGKFEREDEVLVLMEKLHSGEEQRVDRVVIFWDEGNRSAPAMQNAMLSLLAEGVIRRDGEDYRFPPVSCVLTRNPDGYDAQSAKMPSPLIDRFAAQYYVFQPDLYTMVYVIMKNWLKTYSIGLQSELQGALKKLKAFLLEGTAKRITEPKTAVEKRKVVAGIELKIVESCISPPEDTKDKDSAAHKDGASNNLTTLAKQIQDVLREFRTMGITGDKPEDNELVGMLRHSLDTVKRRSRLPKFEDLKDPAQRLALLVLATWGDAREPAEKPGMQYVPREMRACLQALAQINKRRMRSALKRLGDRTRYGSSIRSYINLLERLVAEHLSKGTANVDLGLLRPYLGQYLNHRCETNFNPDREPASANEKTEALLDIANMILYPLTQSEDDKIEKLLADYIVAPSTLELTINSFGDLDGFIQKIRTEQDPVSRFIEASLSTGTREALQNYRDRKTGDDTTSKSSRPAATTLNVTYSLVRNLNKMIRTHNNNREKLFQEIGNSPVFGRLDESTKSLLIDPARDGQQMDRVMRKLIDSTFVDEIKPLRGSK